MRQQQAGITDKIGRPWAQHFERVALRVIVRNPAASRAQIEAVLLHDAMMDRSGGHAMLADLGIGAEAAEIRSTRAALSPLVCQGPRAAA